MEDEPLWRWRAVLKKLRWWLARKLLPRTVDVVVKHGGHQHIQRNVPLSSRITVTVPFKMKPVDDGVDFGGRTLSPTDVEAIIGAGTAAEGSEYWPELGARHIDGDPLKGMETADGEKIEFSRDEITPARLEELREAWACEHEWQDDSAPDKDPEVSKMDHGRTCKKCGAWEP